MVENGTNGTRADKFDVGARPIGGLIPGGGGF